MGALAPVNAWIPEDDLLLKNAVEVTMTWFKCFLASPIFVDGFISVMYPLTLSLEVFLFLRYWEWFHAYVYL